MQIIGYIHICQKGDWKKSLDLLLNSIKVSKLYESTKVIRLGLVNDLGTIIEDDILKDSKFDIIYVGKSCEYERPTLYHMRKKSIEEINTNYFYLHTKGIRHFGSKYEQQIIDWINLMLYWNIENWKIAIEKLKVYDTYGCNDLYVHYSGNFWWAKSSHIKKLPTVIASYYTACEDWVQTIRINKYTVYNSGINHYKDHFPRKYYSNYIKNNKSLPNRNLYFKPTVNIKYALINSIKFRK